MPALCSTELLTQPLRALGVCLTFWLAPQSSMSSGRSRFHKGRGARYHLSNSRRRSAVRDCLLTGMWVSDLSLLLFIHATGLETLKAATNPNDSGKGSQQRPSLGLGAPGPRGHLFSQPSGLRSHAGDPATVCPHRRHLESGRGPLRGPRHLLQAFPSSCAVWVETHRRAPILRGEGPVSL